MGLITTLASFSHSLQQHSCRHFLLLSSWWTVGTLLLAILSWTLISDRLSSRDPKQLHHPSGSSQRESLSEGEHQAGAPAASHPQDATPLLLHCERLSGLVLFLPTLYLLWGPIETSPLKIFLLLVFRILCAGWCLTCWCWGGCRQECLPEGA